LCVEFEKGSSNSNMAKVEVGSQLPAIEITAFERALQSVPRKGESTREPLPLLGITGASLLVDLRPMAGTQNYTVKPQYPCCEPPESSICPSAGSLCSNNQ
jgi:hypothetical protein